MKTTSKPSSVPDCVTADGVRGDHSWNVDERGWAVWCSHCGLTLEIAPAPASDRQVSVLVPQWLKERIRLRAEAAGVSQSAWARGVLTAAAKGDE